MSKLFVSASLLLLIGGPALAASTDAPSEPEQTINAIGADVSARTQWFGNAINHLFDDSAPAPDAAKIPAHKKRHEER